MADSQNTSSDNPHSFTGIALPSLAMEDNSEDEILFEPSFTETEEEDEEDHDGEDGDDDDETEDEGLGERLLSKNTFPF